ncbi:hypothetical protein OG948_54890 (plasmid) [Embleya sp. NBC_00888]|uniref:hypothetical protein n=1 Tax=Embleya sp. NBC_00888 TaxID=2975960 RepID=UPI002F90F56B|nr:hypothetical protein OG948_54890 [Embleya sp. NBC_00888]
MTTRATLTDTMALSTGDSAVFMTVESGEFTQGQRVKVSRDACLLGETVIRLGLATARADEEGNRSSHALIKGIACVRGDVIEGLEG